MTGQRVAPAQLLQTEGTLEVGLLVAGEDVPLEVVPAVEARVAVWILAPVLFRGRLWEVEAVWVRGRGGGGGGGGWLAREGMAGMHVGTWCHGPWLERVLGERERIRLHSIGEHPTLNIETWRGAAEEDSHHSWYSLDGQETGACL